MPRKKPEGEGDFHVVRKRKFREVGTRDVGYESKFFVYCNNVPFLQGAGKPLSRREAQWIASLLNKRFKRVGGRNLVKKAAA